MKVLNLAIRNFMAIGEVKTLPLDDKGLVLIQGENEDDSSQESNGAGKSSIADALCWCFYGETARGESGDQIINRSAKKDTVVEVLIADDTGTEYRVSRHRKHKTYKNMLRLEALHGTVWVDLTKGTDKLTQELVNKVLGCGYDVFSSAIYAGQERMPDLPGMTDKQLKMLVEESAGIDQLQAAHEVARGRLNMAKTELTNVGAKVMSLTSRLESLDESIKEATDRSVAFENGKAHRLIQIEKHIDEAKVQLKPGLGPAIKTRLQQLDTKAADIRAKIAASNDERDTEKALERELTQAQQALQWGEKSLAEAIANAQKLKHALDHVSDKIGSACGECGHVIEAADLAQSEAAAKKSAIEAAQKAKQLKSDLEALRERSVSAQKALDEHRAAMTDVSAQASALSDLEAQRGKLQKGLTEWEAEASTLNALQLAMGEEKIKTNPHLAEINRLYDRIEDATDELTQVREEQAKAQQAVDLAEAAVRVFGPAGVRAHILDTVTPYLNSRTSEYLTTLTDGNISAVWSTVSTTAKGELREKFVIDVASSTGGETFKSLSGGEKRKVRLACAMALQDLVSSRATKPINLFIADEIDHALDSAGLERLMTILEAKSHDKGTVLVISHTDLRDWIRKSITVTKKGGKSALETACLS